MLLPETLIQDLRYAARMLSRNPGFTAVAILALALGIGVNTAVFTGYKAMVARPLDARNPGEMVNVAITRQSGAASFAFSYPDYAAFRDSAHSFSGLIAYDPERMTLSNAGGIFSRHSSSILGPPALSSSKVEFASVYGVSENYFQVLGVSPIRGRTFESMTASDLLTSPSVLISENYWQKRFEGDPAILGKTIHLNGAAVTVIGITPRDFVGTGVVVPDFFTPLSLEPVLHADVNWLRDRENQRYRLFGRLAPQATIAKVQAEMNLIGDRLRPLHDPKSDAAKPATLIVWPGSIFPLPLNRFPGLKLAILLIMTAAGMVLAVASANVGSLQLARARSRQNELHTRLSLGASRTRIVRQLLTESALLGLLAGIFALFFTWTFLKISLNLYTESIPVEYGTLILDVNPDLRIFAAVLAISLVAGLLFGLAPALESSRSAFSSVNRASTSPVRSRRLQDFLLAAQVSLSLVLMIVGSMFIRSSIRSLKTDTGYDSKQVLELGFQFPEASKYTGAHKLALVREIRTRLAALPEVSAITSARSPVDNFFQTAAVASSGQRSFLHYTYVQPNYFQTLGIRLIVGRGLTENSVILSESAAQQLWPGLNPIGRSIRLGAIDERVHNRNELLADGPAYQVAGVAREVRGVEFDGSDSKLVYLPLPEDRLQDRSLLIRTHSNPGQITKAIDPLISSVDPDLMATSSTLAETLRRTAPYIASNLAAGVSTSIGLLGLVLALMGIYGTVSYIVVLRTREVGIRMAIGAQKRDILGLILRESTRPVLLGLLAGMSLALGVSYLLRGIFYGLNGVDALSVIGVPLLFLSIAMLAAYPPSRRALRVDPMVALRYE